MDFSDLPEFEVHTHGRLPVAAAFFRSFGIVELIDRAVPSEMEVGVGTHVLAMVLDCLSGRSPLQQVECTFEDVDTELLFGRPVSAQQFNDDALGRALDRLQAAGVGSLFSAVAMQVCRQMQIPIRCGHFDTTSINVYGDDYCSLDPDALKVTYGYSKDKRPDLKQVIGRMLCVGGNIPILGGADDGNKSDRKINNQELTALSKLLKEHGIDRNDFTYVADCAMVCEDNIHDLDGMNFVTRLPASYGKHDELIDQALEKGMDNWTKIGQLAQEKDSPRRPHASYLAKELPVRLYERDLRAFVIHSEKHDKRKLKAVENAIEKERTALNKLVKKESKVAYACSDDARSALERLRKHVDSSCFYNLKGIVGVEPRYAPGRPKKDGRRNVECFEPKLMVELELDEQAVKQARLRAGCFVLIARIPKEKTSKDALCCYKEQHGIERNFSFLKDDRITNSIFLEKPERIEALMFVLLLALLIWNAMQLKLRRWVKDHDQPLPGNNRQPTRRPTIHVMFLYLKNVQVMKIARQRRLHKPPSPAIMAYLQALELGPWIYTNPSMRYQPPSIK